jgi:hypothetical protein
MVTAIAATTMAMPPTAAPMASGRTAEEEEAAEELSEPVEAPVTPPEPPVVVVGVPLPLVASLGAVTVATV